MKKLFTVLFVFLVCACTFAVAPSFNATNGNYYYALDTTIIVADTISNTDSFTIISNFKGTNKGRQGLGNGGYQWILQRGPLTGETSDDSVNLYLRLDLRNDSGNVVHTLTIDSATTLPGESYLLPIGGSAFCDKFDLKIITISDLGDNIIMPRFYIYKRWIVSQTKPY